jgi:hypothetical protein
MQEMKDLELISDAISIEEEKDIISYIDTCEWSTAIYRRTIHYCYVYDYARKNIYKCQENPSIPDILLPNIVTKYISPHTDSPVFGDTVCSLSLLEDTIMDLSLGDKNWSIVLPRRSLLVMKGKYRREMKHGLKFNGDRRISLTYRTIK